MTMISDAACQTNHSPRAQHIHTIGKDRTKEYGWMVAILVLAAGLCASMAAQAAIPATERQALLDLYTSTNGDAWTDKSGWNGASGTECTWYGITCDDAAEHVTEVSLSYNNLDGSLPSLASLANLSDFGAGFNQLTGPIPSLAGLASLSFFEVGANQLTGPIPPLASLANLSYIYVNSNQLTGPIPSLAGLTNLQEFFAFGNQLTGPIPSLTGLANLQYFDVASNQLTGTIPSLASLTNLYYFDVGFNELTGPIPSLANLTNLDSIVIKDNQLSGPMPSVPSPSMLRAGGSQLCSNYLDPVPNADWDVATGESPWYQNCTPLPEEIFADGFDP